MKVKGWSCLLLAVAAGCSNVDRPYDPPNQGPTAGGGQLQVPPGTPPTWAMNGRTPAAHRGATTAPPLAAQTTGRQTAGMPSTPQGTALMNNGKPGEPGAPLLMAQPNPNADSIVRVASSDDSPLRVVPATGMMTPHEPPVRALDNAVKEMARPLTPPAAEVATNDGAPRRPLRAVSAEDLAPPQPLPIVPTPAGDAAKVDAPTPPKPVDEKPSVSVALKTEENAAGGAPAVRMVNSKRIHLNYAVKDVGPSGVSSVDLWFTRDNKTWQKDESALRSGPPYVVEVGEEGTYGFTLVARSGLGLGREPPKHGDLPQVWVEVDVSKPLVQVQEVKHGVGDKIRELTVTWTAGDRNLARKPITLSYSDKPDGPWTPIGVNMDNTGKHVWTMPAGMPPRFFVRVEAVDLVGNVGSGQTKEAVLIDMSQPKVDILGVEAADK